MGGGVRSEVESLTLSPGPQPLSDWLSSSLQATTAGHFPCDHLREGWAPGTQTELTSFTRRLRLGTEPSGAVTHLCVLRREALHRGDSGLEKSQSWDGFWAPVGTDFSVPAHECSTLCWPGWEKILCDVNVYVR